jgi:hypothetical protein
MAEALIINVRSDELARRTEWIKERDRLLGIAALVTGVENQEQLDASGQIQTAASKHIKLLDKERKAVTGPIDAVKKQIMAQEKEMRATLEIELGRVKGLNDTYATKLAIEAEQERRRQQEEAERQRMEEARQQQEAAELFGDDATLTAPVEPAPAPAPIQQPPKLSGNRTRKRFSFTVINPRQVPDEYKIVDEKKIRAHIAFCEKMENDPSIPGVTFDARISVESK